MGLQALKPAKEVAGVKIWRIGVVKLLDVVDGEVVQGTGACAMSVCVNNKRADGIQITLKGSWLNCGVEEDGWRTLLINAPKICCPSHLD